MFRRSRVARLGTTLLLAFTVLYLPPTTAGAQRTPAATDPQGFYDSSHDVSWGGDDPQFPGAPADLPRTHRSGRLHQEYHVHFWFLAERNRLALQTHSPSYVADGTYQFHQSGNSTTIEPIPGAPQCTLAGTSEGSGLIGPESGHELPVVTTDPKANAYFFYFGLPLKNMIKLSGGGCGKKIESTWSYLMKFGGGFKISQEGDRVWRRGEGGGPCDPHEATQTPAEIESEFDIGHTGVRCTYKFSWRFVQAARPQSSAFLPFPSPGAQTTTTPQKTPPAQGSIGTQTWSIAGQGISGTFTVSADGGITGFMTLTSSRTFTIGTATCTVASPMQVQGTFSGAGIDLSGTTIASGTSGAMALTGDGTANAAFPKAASATGTFTMIRTCGDANPQTVSVPFTAKRLVSSATQLRAM